MIEFLLLAIVMTETGFVSGFEVIDYRLWIFVISWSGASFIATSCAIFVSIMKAVS